MLGRLRRTTRLDVGLAIFFIAVAYLIWSLVAGTSRYLVQELIKWAHGADVTLPALSLNVKVFFVDTGFIIDLIGLVWMIGSLVLVLLASRQRISISWAWFWSAMQAAVAAAGATLVACAAYAPHVVAGGPPDDPSALEQVSKLSLPLVTTVAILIYVTFLVWLLVERARLDRHGPTLRDGQRTNLYS